MESDPAPFIANSLLYYYEKKWLFKQERELQIVTIFSNIFRLIDDLCTVNQNRFENNYSDIYPDLS